MLNTENRKKLKAKVSEVRELLLGSFDTHARARFLLDMKNDADRQTALTKNDPAALYISQLIDTKLAAASLTREAYFKERAYTWLNRIFFLMRFEALGLQTVKTLTGMKSSPGWREFNDFCPDLCNGDDQGFTFLVKQLCDIHSTELPGLFEDDACDREFGIPGLLLYQLIDALNDRDIAEFFKDDTAAGWLYQYFNDPDREAINEKVQHKEKINGDEIASATQLFTERYMVEWLLQNSLGNQWLAICKKNDWQTPSHGVITTLAAKRRDHNDRIARKELSEDTPLPIDADEVYWQYYMQRELSAEEVASAPASIRDIKLLDPACGSGHFLIYAFELLFHFYKEEDAVRIATEPNHIPQSDADIAYAILENNLYGVDLDPRAVQIAAASLYTMARRFGKHSLKRLNLVAARPAIGGQNKPALQQFITNLATETNLPADAAQAIVETLQSSAILGSLLQVRTEIRKALEKFGFFNTEAADTEASIYAQLEAFLAAHDSGDDLGFYQMANQLSRGLRLLRILDQQYDVVCANPPYMSLSKLEGKTAEIYINRFSSDVDDLYQTFYYLYDQLAKPTGFIACVTMHGWMFISQFREFRANFLKEHTIRSLAHLGANAFDEVKGEITAVALYVYQHQTPKAEGTGIYLRDVKSLAAAKAKSLLNQPPTRLYHFAQSKFAEIEGSPMIYWWPQEFREWYLKAAKIGEDIRQGAATSDNSRFLRNWYEVGLCAFESNESKWRPYLKGARGARWFESLNNVIVWLEDGKEVKNYAAFLYTSFTRTIKSIDKYFQRGVTYSDISAADFFCRLSKYASIFDVTGSSIFLSNPEEVQVALSTRVISYVSQSLNPTIHNQVGDTRRLPIPSVKNWQSYYDRAKTLYDGHFAQQETNIEYEYRGDRA